MTIAATLLRIRTEQGLTQAEMARELGCALRTYLRYETGSREPPTSIWLKAAALEQ